MEEGLLRKIDRLSDIEKLDRSTLVRKLLREGYKDYLKRKAAERYKRGEITISQAAKEAETTIWEIEKFLVEGGYKSDYSVKDLKEEISNLRAVRK